MKTLDYSGSHGDSAAVNGDSEEPTELEVSYDHKSTCKQCSDVHDTYTLSTTVYKE